MNSRSMLSALAAGLLGVVMWVVPLWIPFAGVILRVLSPLPLFAVGLTFGVEAAIAATGIAVIVCVGFGAFPGGLAYGLSDGLPAIFVCWLFHHHLKRAPQTPVSVIEAIVLQLSLLVIAIISVGLLLVPEDFNLLTQIEASYRQTLTVVLGLSASEIASLPLETWAKMTPGLSGIIWELRTLVSAVLAWKVLQVTGQIPKMTFPFCDIKSPWGLSVAMGLAVLALFPVSGRLEIIAITIALLLAFPLILQGLAVIHVAVRPLSHPRVLLTVFYGLFLFSTLVALPAMIGLGLVDQLTGLRSRMGRVRRQEDV